MRITKGIIAAAGRGTRFLPATKAAPKELLPVVDKPIIQYIVEEFVAAGITDIVIVHGPDSRALKEHFSRSISLEKHLRQTGKAHMAAEMRGIADMANFIFIEQKGPYGNGTPCWNARRIIGREPFAYAFGDDLVLTKTSFTKSMIKDFRKQQGIYVGAQEVAASQVNKYGILKTRGRQVLGIIEKPDVKTAPSRLAAFGRYLLTAEIFSALEKTGLGKGGELWLADAVHDLIKQGKTAYYKKVSDGAWYTTGDPISYLRAVRAFALARPDFRNKVKEIFK